MLGIHTRDPTGALEVSHLLHFCLLEALRWEQMDVFSSQEDRAQERQHPLPWWGCPGQEDVKKWSKSVWGRESDASKLSIQMQKLLVSSVVNSNKY